MFQVRALRGEEVYAQQYSNTCRYIRTTVEHNIYNTAVREYYTLFKQVPVREWVGGCVGGNGGGWLTSFFRPIVLQRILIWSH